MQRPPPRRLVLASGNAGKLAELRELLGPLGIELVSQHEFGIGDAEESGLTFIENALIKARHAARLSRLPALADDSGLCVDALGGAPGLHSATYAGRHGDDAANVERLLADLDGVPPVARTGHFHCSIVLLRDAEDPAPLVAEGRWSGRILSTPRGSHGFGYDPVFAPEGNSRSAAELQRTEKNRISHRGLALRALIALLQGEQAPAPPPA